MISGHSGLHNKLNESWWDAVCWTVLWNYHCSLLNLMSSMLQYWVSISSIVHPRWLPSGFISFACHTTCLQIQHGLLTSEWMKALRPHFGWIMGNSQLCYSEPAETVAQMPHLSAPDCSLMCLTPQMSADEINQFLITAKISLSSHIVATLWNLSALSAPFHSLGT